MMSKDSVKSRLEKGMSFTEFSYQLIQGYDFYWLHKNKNCKVQLGGSDQWGNIVTGTELIRRKGGSDAFACTTPLIKKANGTKFGKKTEDGNVWLDKNRTPYKFYQYWINCSDKDAVSFIKIFHFKIPRRNSSFRKRTLRRSSFKNFAEKKLAEDITIRVHSREDLNAAISGKILFKKGPEVVDDLKQMRIRYF